jgi:hypothetical protein
MIAYLGVEVVRLVDEEYATSALFENAACFQRCLPQEPSCEVLGCLDIHSLIGDEPKTDVHAPHQLSNRRLARARVTEEQKVEVGALSSVVAPRFRRGYQVSAFIELGLGVDGTGERK